MKKALGSLNSRSSQQGEDDGGEGRALLRMEERERTGE